MLIIQLTDGSPGTTSWFPPRQPHLVLGADFGGGMKDISSLLHVSTSSTAHAMDAVGISWDEISTLPTDPSPAVSTSHTAGEEAVG